MISGVYGPDNSGMLGDFLDDLEWVHITRCLPWCIGGDYHEILYVGERHRGIRRMRRMDCFGRFVDIMGLLDILTIGPQFTWSNFQPDPSMSKLDRFLISTDWEAYFPRSRLWIF